MGTFQESTVLCENAAKSILSQGLKKGTESFQMRFFMRLFLKGSEIKFKTSQKVHTYLKENFEAKFLSSSSFDDHCPLKKIFIYCTRAIKGRSRLEAVLLRFQTKNDFYTIFM